MHAGTLSYNLKSCLMSAKAAGPKQHCLSICTLRSQWICVAQIQSSTFFIISSQPSLLESEDESEVKRCRKLPLTN